MATLREAAGSLGIKVDWDPATQTATVGGQTFGKGQVPGTYYDAASGQHIISDPTIFKSTFAPQSMAAPVANPLVTPTFTAAQPQTVSTSGMKSDIRNYMNSPIMLPEYTPTDLSGLQDWVNAFQQQYGQGPFNSQGMMDIIMGIQGMQAPDMKYQTPEQLQQLQQVWMQAMQPNMDAQQALMQQAYQQALGDITKARAGQGLLGGPATERMYAQQAGNYGLQTGALQAQTAMDALLQAFNYAQLGLQEQGQNFDQNLAAQQAALSGYGTGLGMQQQGAGTAIDMLQQLLGMQEGQNQFGVNLGVTGEQMRQNQQQFGLGQLANILGMDIGQNQWAQDFGQQSLRDQYNQWAGTEGLNMQQAGLTGQYQGAPTLAQKQFDLSRDLGIAGMTGQLYGQDTMAKQAMIADYLGQFQGQNTMSLNNLMAGLSGVNPYTGKQTYDAYNADRQYNLALGEMMGSFNGAPTLAARRAEMEGTLAKAGFDREISLGVMDGINSSLEELKKAGTPEKRQAILDREKNAVDMMLRGGVIDQAQAGALTGMIDEYLGKPVANYPLPWWQRMGGTSGGGDVGGGNVERSTQDEAILQYLQGVNPPGVGGDNSRYIPEMANPYRYAGGGYYGNPFVQNYGQLPEAYQRASYGTNPYNPGTPAQSDMWSQSMAMPYGYGNPAYAGSIWGMNPGSLGSLNPWALYNLLQMPR